jgi:glycosyltransferase 2 family protein
MRVLRSLAGAVTSGPGRVIVSVALLAVVAASIDWDVLTDSLSGAAWGWFVLGVVLIGLALLVGAFRWYLLLHGAELPTTPADTLRAYAIGIFSNNFLPTGFGGDPLRAWLIGRSGKPLARALTSVFVDRGAALAALFCIGWIGYLAAPVSVPRQLETIFFLVSGAGLIALIVGVVLLRRRGLGRYVPSAIRPWASEVARTLREYGHNHRLQIQTLGLSLGYQVLSIASLWALSEAIGLDLSPAVLAIVVPIVLLATLAPISVAGLGVREGTYVLLLGDLGVSSSDATLLSLFTVAALALASLPGGVAIAMGRGKKSFDLESAPPEVR